MRIKTFIIILVSIIVFSGCSLRLPWRKDIAPAPEEPLVDANTPFFLDVSALDAFNALKANEDLVVVQVGENLSGRSLPRALKFELDGLASGTDIFSFDKPILVYGENEADGLKAADMLVRQGFKTVYRLEDFGEWVREGFPTEDFGE